jgi:hypothetical protein
VCLSPRVSLHAGQNDGAGRKQARATPMGAASIRFDGRLDDEIWQRAVPVTDFRQAEPDEGAAPTDPMEIRFLYDDTALWVGARMSRSQTSPIQAPMSRRDDGEQAEYLQVELDTYLDRRTAYMFGVTASGVRLDHYHSTDAEDSSDPEFDPVWEARTHVADDGWTAELWLPFSQLRFNDQPERVWGMNIKRWRPDLNEQDYWIVIGRTERGWSSRFGELRGIDGIRPRTRLELLPYVASSSRMTGNRDLKNPFDDGTNLGGRVGADMKLGIGPNLTLEATINPDFGQVEADPADVNLTVLETIFDERRPFFIEGNNVLAAGTGNYYYSRRVGARPTRPASGDYVDYPQASTILGATKLTGRLKSGTSLGFLAAFTNKEFASIETNGIRSELNVAPRTAWGVGRVIQELGPDSTVGAHLTLVHRDLSVGDPLAAMLVRNAITAGFDTRVRFHNRTYEAAFNVGFTHLDGEPASVERVQRAAGHYFQRLDQPTIRLDPTRRTFDGTQIQGSFNKVAGRHWLWGGNIMIESPEFDTLDFGRLNYAGDVQGGPRLTYRETQPGRIFRGYSLGVNLGTYQYFDRDLGVRYTLGSNNSFTLRNFWTTSLNVSRYFRGLDSQLTRGGPAMGTPLGLNVSGSLANSTSSQTRWNGSVNYRSNEYGEAAWFVDASVSARPSPALQLSVAPHYATETGVSGIFSGPIGRQFLPPTLGDGRVETYGQRYIFGLPDRTTLSTQFRVSYTFKPDVTLDVYAEPFAASDAYRGIGELAVSRGRDLRMYGTDGTTLERLLDGSYRITDGGSTFTVSNRDFNRRSFRSNIVLRWEWRPGSTFYGVWQQNRASSVARGEHVGVGDLFGSFSAEGDNIVALKTTFWISR